MEREASEENGVAAADNEPNCPAGGSLCQNSDRQKTTPTDEVLGKEEGVKKGDVKQGDGGAVFPLVSVCVVTYNHGKYIGECLRSILSQRGNFRLEILVHDDASNDDAQEIIRDFAARYPDVIRPILREENQYSKGFTNITGIFNIPRARGKYVAMLDGDDYWCDIWKLQKQVSYMESHPGCVFCFHSARVISEEGYLPNGSLMRPYRKSGLILGRELVDRAGGAPFASFLFRRDVLTELPRYYYNCPVGDRPLELVAAAHGDAYYFDEAMSVYRFSHKGSWTEDQLSGDFRKKQRRYVRKMTETYRDFDRETGGRFHREAVRAARRVRFLSAVNMRDFPEIRKKENRAFFRELSLRDRFFILFEMYFPAVYRLARNAFRAFRPDV